MPFSSIGLCALLRVARKDRELRLVAPSVSEQLIDEDELSLVQQCHFESLDNAHTSRTRVGKPLSRKVFKKRIGLNTKRSAIANWLHAALIRIFPSRASLFSLRALRLGYQPALVAAETQTASRRQRELNSPP